MQVRDLLCSPKAFTSQQLLSAVAKTDEAHELSFFPQSWVHFGAGAALTVVDTCSVQHSEGPNPHCNGKCTHELSILLN